RGAGDEEAAESRPREIAAEAERLGPHTHRGGKGLELRPTDAAGKDLAAGALIDAAEVRAAAYAGDDRTDLDAFRRLRELREDGRLSAAVCVGVLSPEGPAELAEECEVTVDGLDGWLEILRWLAE